MYSGLIMGHILVVAGSFLASWNLTGWYKDLMNVVQGEEPTRKPRWIDGFGLFSGMLLVSGGVCYIIHWIIDYRLV